MGLECFLEKTAGLSPSFLSPLVLCKILCTNPSLARVLLSEQEQREKAPPSLQQFSNKMKGISARPCSLVKATGGHQT